jgi:hypothetical protein
MEDRIFSPKYIPYFLILEKPPFKFNIKSIKIYGFIAFYLKQTKATEFYFTDEQIGIALDIYPTKVQESLRILTDHKLIYRFTKYDPKINKRRRFIEINSGAYQSILGGHIPQIGSPHIPQNGSYNENIKKIINKENIKTIDLDKTIYNPNNLFEIEEGSIPKLPF